ncbi:hypothetical protein [Azonexus sp.]|uniref:hypothetical protein n=1 Tax=Azonexus sp. TaxID=1872668 RepID=UPI0027B8CC38|nr:hypothetical protein [Azonexus sp.]
MNPLFQFWQVWGGTLIGLLLVIVSVVYFVRFVLPGWLLDRKLQHALQSLRVLPAGYTQGETEKQLGDSFRSPALKTLWLTYAATLQGPLAKTEHPWQATLPAEHVFSEETLIDTPLKTGFYRHLPGILTGIGIIGTFSGLIVGLSAFQVTSEADAVRNSLESLIRSVGHAFEISAAAITLAMIFTWVEKSLITRLQHKVAQLCQQLNQRFALSSGDAALMRLVLACETTAAQGPQMRQTLAGELRQGLQALIAEQRSSSQQHQEALAGQIASAVAQTLDKNLGEPLQRMTQAVEGLGAQQNTHLAQALNETLLRFSSQVERQVGQGQGRLEELLQNTAQTLAALTTELGKVAGNLENAGQSAFNSAAGQLQNAGQDVQRVGQTFSQTFAHANKDMAQAASAMAQAAQSISLSMVEQSRLQQQVASMAADLRSTVELARRDAGLTSELVSRLEQATRNLAAAEGKAGDYLQSVNQVLGDAHAAFAENIEQTLVRGNNQFQRSVVTAVEALEGAIEELSDALSQAPARR